MRASDRRVILVAAALGAAAAPIAGALVVVAWLRLLALSEGVEAPGAVGLARWLVFLAPGLLSLGAPAAGLAALGTRALVRARERGADAAALRLRGVSGGALLGALPLPALYLALLGGWLGPGVLAAGFLALVVLWGVLGALGGALLGLYMAARVGRDAGPDGARRRGRPGRLVP